MDDNLRACLAHIGAKVMNHGSRPSVYDFLQSRHIVLTGRVEGNRVQFFDHSRGTQIHGTLPQLYDYGLNCHVSMTVTGLEVKGYDHGSDSHYSGRLSGHTMTMYDHGNVRHYYYGV